MTLQRVFFSPIVTDSFYTFKDPPVDTWSVYKSTIRAKIFFILLFLGPFPDGGPSDDEDRVTVLQDFQLIFFAANKLRTARSIWRARGGKSLRSTSGRAASAG